MTDWQPIETAPRDGTTVLGYLPGRRLDEDRDDVVTIYWHDLWGTPGWCITESGEGVGPTHWMPLPEPPGA